MSAPTARRGLSSFSYLWRTTFGLASVAGAGYYAYSYRHIASVPVTPNDPIFSSPVYLRNNPNRNPETKDLFVKSVPIGEIGAGLLEKDGRVAEVFCAGVWAGTAYEIQRRYLARKYQNEDTKHNLWSKQELRDSSYDVGTVVTDHFEVVSKTPESIIVRCGDTPRNQGVRDSDGLFEMSAVVKRDQGVVEFGVKSVFYQGLGVAPNKPMPEHIEFAHRVYAKLLLDSAIAYVRQQSK